MAALHISFGCSALRYFVAHIKNQFQELVAIDVRTIPFLGFSLFFSLSLSLSLSHGELYHYGEIACSRSIPILIGARVS